MGNVVLVHGAWGGAWSWDKVAPELRDRGHEVRTPVLHRGSLAADTAAVQAEVDDLGGTAVACGWSYGGMVITGLELAPGSRLVYVAAILPDEGETALDLVSRIPTGLNEIVGQDEDDMFVLTDEARIDEVLWADAEPEEAAWARRQLRSQSGEPMGVPAARLAWRDVPSTYILCRQDRAVHPDTQRVMAARATEVVEWDSSHAPMLSRPADLVALLDKLAS